jgi:ribosomal protein L39E
METKRRRYQKKVKLAVHNRRTGWAPFWAVIKKYGKGKRIHPSQMTSIRRNWRKSKLKIKPRTDRRRYSG